jgi:hypothetical protein
LIDDYRDYAYSSYHAHLESSKATKLNGTEVLVWFGGEVGYQIFHAAQQEQMITLINAEWIIE